MAKRSKRNRTRPAKLCHCHHCGKSLRVQDAEQTAENPLSYCVHCGGDVRERSVACRKCGVRYFDGLRDPPLSGKFCCGCGRTLSSVLKGLPQ